MPSAGVRRIREPCGEVRHAMADSRRWTAFTPRAGDIFISTPAKCGTTWMQEIVASLLWPGGDAPDVGAAMSPWLEQRTEPIGALLERLEGMEHRRFIKTHSPADSIPVFEGCTYVLVHRSPLDAFLSWANHWAGLRPELWDAVNATAPDEGIEPTPPWRGDMDQLFEHWITTRLNPPDHLASWWHLRGQADVVFVHYDDLLRDLDGEMRRIARHLGLQSTAEEWPAVVARCRFDQMRSAFGRSGVLDLAFDQGAQRFFHRGTPGRGAAELPSALQARCTALTAAHLPADVADWLSVGSLLAGWRP